MLQRDESFCLEFCRRLTLAKARSWWHWSLFHVAEVEERDISRIAELVEQYVSLPSASSMRP